VQTVLRRRKKQRETCPDCRQQDNSAEHADAKYFGDGFFHRWQILIMDGIAESYWNSAVLKRGGKVVGTRREGTG
jgi:hypothetical protein